MFPEATHFSSPADNYHHSRLISSPFLPVLLLLLTTVLRKGNPTSHSHLPIPQPQAETESMNQRSRMWGQWEDFETCRCLIMVVGVVLTQEVNLVCRLMSPWSQLVQPAQNAGSKNPAISVSYFPQSVSCTWQIRLLESQQGRSLAIVLLTGVVLDLLYNRVVLPQCSLRVEAPHMKLSRSMFVCSIGRSKYHFV